MRFINRNKKYILIIFLFIGVAFIFISTFFNIGFISDSFGFVTVPVQKFFSSSTNWVDSKINLLSNFLEIENENIKLKEEIAKDNLSEQHRKLLEEENKKLNDLLNMSQRYSNFKTTGAHVIAKDSGGWFSIFVIDKGVKDGLKESMVVLDSNGLVGKITECRNNFSKVISIVNDKSSVSIRNTRTNNLGFAKGDLKLKNSGLCNLEFLDTTSEIVDGDEIVTSQLSEIFPPGILVGRAKKIISDSNLDSNPNDNSQRIVLESAADLKHLDTVLVITEVFKEQTDFNLEE